MTARRAARPFRLAGIALLVAGLVIAIDGLTGWRLAYRLAVAILYRRADLPASRIVADQRYASTSGADQSRLRFDLYLPEGRGWPMVVFAHGGGWREGDKNLTVAGADVYANIGRFLAGHGIGTAIVNYRLLPTVTWQVQIDDVAHAVAAARQALVARGGRSAALFLMGHSAGAQLVTRVALDPDPLRRAGASTADVCGVIPVSGAALDLTDARTWQLGADEDYYRERFASPGATDWKREASPVRFVTSAAPPFLIAYAQGESKPLQRQSERLAERLRDAEVPVFVVREPGSSHERIVLALSRDSTVSAQVVRFVTSLRCWPRAGRPEDDTSSARHE